MYDTQEILNIIHEASGTEAYHQFSAIKGFPVITDGVLALAEAAGCYWLLDIVGSYQTNKKLDKAFQVWTLEVNEESRNAVVNGKNDTKIVITQEIEYTDFPLSKVKLFLINGVILLPSEY